MTKTEQKNGQIAALKLGELLTIDELSEILKTKEKTIRQWVYQGRIPSIKMNGLLRFAAMEIDSWLKLKARGRQAC